MKSIGALLLLSVMLLSSCASGIPNIESYTNNLDDQYTLSGYSWNYICETDSSYYFLSGHNETYLFIYDKEKRKAVPLCNKPDCKHMNETDGYRVTYCNAYLGDPTFLELYKDSIYYIGSVSTLSGSIPTLYKISLDGTKRQIVLSFSEDIMYCVVHRGYLYYVHYGPKTDDENDRKYEYKLLRQSVDNPSQEPELIMEGYEYCGKINDLICYGGNLYYSLRYYTDESLEEEVQSIYVYDIQNKTTRLLVENGAPPYTIFNGSFIYHGTDGTYMCDLSGDNCSKVTDKTGLYSANSKYLFIYNYPTRVVTVFDKDFHVVKTITLDETYLQPIGCSEEYYFISRKPGENQYGYMNTIWAVSLDGGLEDAIPEIFYQFVPETMFPGVYEKIN